MSNLIVTIISIALIAVAAIMGIFYGGQAYQAANGQALLNAFISQNTQLLSTSQNYSLDNGGIDVVPMCGLYNGKYISTFPNIINLDPGPVISPFTSGVQQVSSSSALYSTIERYIAGYQGTFIIITAFQGVGGANYTTDTGAKDWIVQLALSYNKTPYANVPSSFSSYTTTNGLPYIQGSNTNVVTATGDTVSPSGNTGCSGGNPHVPTKTPVAANIPTDATTGKILTGCYYGYNFINCYQTM